MRHDSNVRSSLRSGRVTASSNCHYTTHPMEESQRIELCRAFTRYCFQDSGAPLPTAFHRKNSPEYATRISLVIFFSVNDSQDFVESNHSSKQQPDDVKLVNSRKISLASHLFALHQWGVTSLELVVSNYEALPINFRQSATSTAL